MSMTVVFCFSYNTNVRVLAAPSSPQDSPCLLCWCLCTSSNSLQLSFTDVVVSGLLIPPNVFFLSPGFAVLVHSLQFACLGVGAASQPGSGCKQTQQMTTWYNSLKPEDANVMCLLASFC
jgi:hypothetical protein